jgi:CheY-like chemotaxis protein
MPELLVLATDNEHTELLASMGKERGFRVRTTSDLHTAYEWLRVRLIDVVLVEAGFSLEAQQGIGERLWRSSPNASFLVFDPGGATKDLFRVRVTGADLAYGARFLSAVQETLDAVAAKKVLESRGEGTILVVEDLDAPRDIICMVIEAKGGTVEGASSGEAAIERLVASPDKYVCVVSDVKMPGMGGRGLIDHIRSSPNLQHLPIVVLTAYGSVDTLVDCLAAGATGFLLKPPKTKDLDREIARAVRLLRRGGNPRLVSEEEAESIRGILVARGFI